MCVRVCVYCVGGESAALHPVTPEPEGEGVSLKRRYASVNSPLGSGERGAGQFHVANMFLAVVGHPGKKIKGVERRRA